MQMAEAILKENEEYLGTEVIEESIEKLEKTKKKKTTKEKKGGNKDGKNLSRSTKWGKFTKTI